MEQDATYRDEKIKKYRAQIEPLLRFIPWLESKVGSVACSQYKQDNFAKSSLTFPVYDSVLMEFVRTVEQTDLLDRNYVYLYSRHNIKTIADEKRCIEAVDLSTADRLNGILSKYMIKGRTKTELWSQGVEEGVYLAILRRWKRILEIWDGPLL